MKTKKFIVPAILTALISTGFGGEITQAADTQNTVESHTHYQESDGRYYESKGLQLYIPHEYDSLLLTEVLKGKKGIFFTVSEKASIEAAKAENSPYEGAGWLFTIGKISDKELDDMLRFDASGRELFAKDEDGNHYVYYHPTDVRYMRQNNEEMERDQDIWTKLNEWAWGFVREDFIKNNPGLIAETAEDFIADRDMKQLGYKPDDLIGGWVEKIAGRGYIEISRAGKGTYDVKISWGNSACETYFWEMTAKADSSNGIRYQNGRHYIVTYDGQGHETKKLVYENGRGRFFLNSADEVMWQDDNNHTYENAVFVSTHSRK